MHSVKQVKVNTSICTVHPSLIRSNGCLTKASVIWQFTNTFHISFKLSRHHASVLHTLYIIQCNKLKLCWENNKTKKGSITGAMVKSSAMGAQRHYHSATSSFILGGKRLSVIVHYSAVYSSCCRFCVFVLPHWTTK